MAIFYQFAEHHQPVLSADGCNTFSRRARTEGYDSPGQRTGSYRRVPTSPECIMDMPGLRDDFYTNLLDWSSRNMIAVALHNSTYIWNADSKVCQRVQISVPGASPAFYISSLSWDPRGRSLAIATNDGHINVCDVEKMTNSNHSQLRERCPIGAMLWTDIGIISGNRKGVIAVEDLRANHIRKCLSGSSDREVCGLSLAVETSCLASGSDDGVVNIWDLRMMQRLRSIEAHSACVKALSWCPWRQGVLATGGGTSDGHIRLWYAHSGEKLGETYTRAQVCGLVWSDEYKELLSSTGSPEPDKNDLLLWSMKNCEFEPLGRLRQHLGRPLHIAISPDKTTIASAGADESLCLWNTFPKRCRRRLWNQWDKSVFNPTRYIR
ncbi:cell division cycle protein 20 homolog [Dreissena polymorpha]|uniref:cell division cycle protein 20 homolog n=1 Tax=Dreissena polymorpha TaxID=45954 RepID=UPI002264460B|nr:cell division cycle protein 20 homolog [Dreissena polymorpha]